MMRKAKTAMKDIQDNDRRVLRPRGCKGRSDFEAVGEASDKGGQSQNKGVNVKSDEKELQSNRIKWKRRSDLRRPEALNTLFGELAELADVEMEKCVKEGYLDVLAQHLLPEGTDKNEDLLKTGPTSRKVPSHQQQELMSGEADEPFRLSAAERAAIRTPYKQVDGQKVFDPSAYEQLKSENFENISKYISKLFTEVNQLPILEQQRVSTYEPRGTGTDPGLKNLRMKYQMAIINASKQGSPMFIFEGEPLTNTKKHGIFHDHIKAQKISFSEQMYALLNVQKELIEEVKELQSLKALLPAGLESPSNDFTEAFSEKLASSIDSVLDVMVQKSCITENTKGIINELLAEEKWTDAMQSRMDTSTFYTLMVQTKILKESGQGHLEISFKAQGNETSRFPF